MSAKRNAGPSSRASASSGSGSAVTNALLVAAATAWGLNMLVQRGRLTWPPYALLNSLATIAGCLALAWMGQFAHQLKHSCDWRITALARSLLAFVFAVGMARASGAMLVLWKPGALWVRGCASSLSLLCTFYALASMSGSEVLTLTNTFPIWVAFLSWPLLRQRPTLAVWAAGRMARSVIWRRRRTQQGSQGSQGSQRFHEPGAGRAGAAGKRPRVAHGPTV